jgi:hypothetical protein
MVLEWSSNYYGFAMKAEFRRLHSPDVEDLVDWAPEDDAFAVLVQIMAAPEGSPGEESFDVTVCSPAWVTQLVERGGIIEGRHMLIVANYDYSRLRDYILEYVSSCSGETWQQVAAKLSRLGRWEFEDYSA